MPNGPVEMIEYDPKGDVLFAATDVGVFDRKDGDTSWYKVSVGLPNTPMMDLKLSGDGKELIVATFGRSQFKLPLSVDATDGGGVGRQRPGHARADARYPGALRRVRAGRGARLQRRRRPPTWSAAPATRR